MINEEYIRGSVFGVGGLGWRQRVKLPIVDAKAEDFSFLLELSELQKSRKYTPREEKEMADSKGWTIEDPLEQVLNKTSLAHRRVTPVSLAEFERDMDLLAEGLESLPVHYHGTYSREDIYSDDE